MNRTARYPRLVPPAAHLAAVVVGATIALAVAVPAPASAQNLQLVGQVDQHQDAGPELRRLSAAHGGQLLVIGSDVFAVPPGCREDADPGDAARGGAPADTAAPYCTLAADRSGFWFTGAEQVDRVWYVDRRGMRRLTGPPFVAFATAPGDGEGDLRAEANEINGIFNRGTAAFRNGEHAAAAAAFTRASELDPHFRDAWFYRLLALEKLGAWEAMIDVGERTLELDPLNQSAMLLLARAYNRTLSGQPTLSSGERDTRRDRLRHWRARMNQEPVYFSAGARLDAACRLEGTLVGGTAGTGRPVPLRVVVRDAMDNETEQRVIVEAPARGSAAQVAIPLDGCGAYSARARYSLDGGR
jgi:tetratricopeptide (TPR) repeat protein